MLGVPLPPPTADENLMESMRAAAIHGANHSALNADELRDAVSWRTNGGWLVILLVILGIAALVLLRLWFAGAL